MIRMYTISAKQKLTLFHTASEKELALVRAKPLEERFWAFHALILEQLPACDSEGDKLAERDKLWSKLNKPQQIVLSFGKFIAQVGNGGVWQFFFNCTEFSWAMAEAFGIFGVGNLYRNFYVHCMEEFSAIAGSGKLREIFATWNDLQLPFEVRWAAFKRGQTLMPSHQRFDSHFLRGQTELYRDLDRYIEKNLGKLLVIDTGARPAIFDKKQAIEHFGHYLRSFYKVVPLWVKPYYSANVTIDNQAQRLFLMEFEMPDGYHSIGITGFFTHHFANIRYSHIKAMHQRHHKQRLVNTYYGGHLMRQTLLKDPQARKVNQVGWQDLLRKLQNPAPSANAQIPVNVEIVDYFKYQEVEYYFYAGDLMYDPKKPFPDSFNNVLMWQTGEKSPLAYQGERNMLFTSLSSEKGFRRQRNDPDSIENICLIERCLGAKHKLIDDNPWGF